MKYLKILFFSSLLSSVAASGQVTLGSWSFVGASDGSRTHAADGGNQSGSASMEIGGGSTGDLKIVSDGTNTDAVSLQKGSKWNGSDFTFTFDASSVSGGILADFDAEWNVRQSGVYGVTTVQASYAVGTDPSTATYTDVGSPLDVSAAGDGIWDSYSIDIGSVLDGEQDAILRLTFSGGSANWASEAQTNFDNMQISAVPEPSTYAALFGGLALAGVLWRRRRS